MIKRNLTSKIINIVKGIANRYGKILICEPNYDGAKVNV